MTPISVMPTRSNASNTPPPRSIPRSRSSTSTPSGPTPPTWNAAPRPSRSAWRASLCVAARYSSGCSRGPAFAGRSPIRCPRRCGWRGRGSRTFSSPIRPPIGARCASLRGSPPSGPRRGFRSWSTRSPSSTYSTPRLPLPPPRLRPCPFLGHAPLLTGGPARQPVRACLELDAGLWLLDGRVRIGAKRSPVHTPAQAAALARAIVAREGVELVGMMAYEAQIAGLGDAPSGPGLALELRAGAVRRLQALSARELAARRATRWRPCAPSPRWSSSTAAAPAASKAPRARTPSPSSPPARGCTGRGCSTPTAPSLPVPPRCSRCPLCAARAPAWPLRSGAATSPPAPPTGRACPGPTCLPVCVSIARREPVRCRPRCSAPPRTRLAVGDRVWMRHAKAGELCERFSRLHLIEGDRVVEEVPTYRGEGQCFL